MLEFLHKSISNLKPVSEAFMIGDVEVSNLHVIMDVSPSFYILKIELRSSSYGSKTNPACPACLQPCSD
jgi:hypothetical protein